MSTMLGGPLIMGGPAQEQTNNALASLSRAQLFDIMSQMKLMAMQNSKQLRELLISHPQLSKALLQAQVMLGEPPGRASAHLACVLSHLLMHLLMHLLCSST